MLEDYICYDNYQCYNKNIIYNKSLSFNDYIVIFNVLVCGLFLGFSFVSIFVFKPMYEKAINEDFFCEYPEIPYEYKYELKDFSLYKMENPDNKINKNSFVCENTPDGNVILRYDPKEEGFIYWCDKNVKFFYLDAVARKFVNNFCCGEYYIKNNIYDVETSGEDTEDHKDGEDDKDGENNENKKDTEDKKDTEHKKDTEDVFFRSSQCKKDHSKEHNDIKRNKFIRVGKFNEFSFLKPYEFEEKMKKQKMTFDVFKQLFYK